MLSVDRLTHHVTPPIPPKKSHTHTALYHWQNWAYVKELVGAETLVTVNATPNGRGDAILDVERCVRVCCGFVGFVFGVVECTFGLSIQFIHIERIPHIFQINRSGYPLVHYDPDSSSSSNSNSNSNGSSPYKQSHQHQFQHDSGAPPPLPLFVFVKPEPRRMRFGEFVDTLAEGDGSEEEEEGGGKGGSREVLYLSQQDDRWVVVVGFGRVVDAWVE